MAELTKVETELLAPIRAYILRCHQVESAEGKKFMEYEVDLDTCLTVIDRLTAPAEKQPPYQPAFQPDDGPPYAAPTIIDRAVVNCPACGKHVEFIFSGVVTPKLQMDTDDLTHGYPPGTHVNGGIVGRCTNAPAEKLQTDTAHHAETGLHDGGIGVGLPSLPSVAHPPAAPALVPSRKALNTACENSQRYPHAIKSHACNWPECKLTCKGREHRLSASAALSSGLLSPMPTREDVRHTIFMALMQTEATGIENPDMLADELAEALLSRGNH